MMMMMMSLEHFKDNPTPTLITKPYAVDPAFDVTNRRHTFSSYWIEHAFDSASSLYTAEMRFKMAAPSVHSAGNMAEFMVSVRFKMATPSV